MQVDSATILNNLVDTPLISGVITIPLDETFDLYIGIGSLAKGRKGKEALLLGQFSILPSRALRAIAYPLISGWARELPSHSRPLDAVLSISNTIR